jgi:DNA-binding MarR family transcriptional regulator
MSLASDLEARLTTLFGTLQRETSGGDELSRTSAAVLHMLCDAPRRVTELAESQAVAQPTMTVLLQRLEARGLLARHRDSSDRRVTNVVITDAGRATLAGRRARRAEALAARLRTLTSDERAALRAALPALDALTHQNTTAIA